MAADCCPPGALSKPSSSCQTCVEGRLIPAVPCNPCGTVWTADVSLSAWQAIEEGLEFALANNPLPAPSNLNVNGSLIAPDFDWDPAFKLNLGMLFPERGWDAQFRWTYFHSCPERSASGTLIPLWAFPNTAPFTFGSARSNLELNFNGFDIETGYHPFLTPKLSLRFLAGLKVATIHQTYYVHYSDGTSIATADTTLTNRAIGAGPRLGFESKWRIDKGFSVLGSIAGSLPLWHYRVTRTDHDPNLSLAHFRERFWTFRTNLEAALGFGWDTCFGCRGQYPFGISALYEFQYYSEQNMMAMLVNPGLMSQAYMPRGDLMLHGATFTFHFGF